MLFVRTLAWLMQRLAALGCKIVIQGRNEAGPAQYGEGTTLTDVAAAVGKRYKVPTMKALADLTQADQVDKMMKAIIKKFGTIDILVHNAGGDIAKKGGKPKPNSEQRAESSPPLTRSTRPPYYYRLPRWLLRFEFGSDRHRCHPCTSRGQYAT